MQNSLGLNAGALWRATTRALMHLIVSLSLLHGATTAHAQDLALGAGDILKISVYQNPDLTLETRVSDAGTISFPLIGSVTLGGLSVPAAEQRIGQMLRDGGFVKQPQVTILVTQLRSSQVSVLGQVNRPGAYPLDKPYKLSEMLAVAGGIMPSGADTIVLTRGNGSGSKTETLNIDIAQMFLGGETTKDIVLAPGDVLYVHRAPLFYIYGEAQRPGSYRLERGMTVMQALAQGGGVTARGTERGLQIHRRDASGHVRVLEPKMDELLRSDDVVYVKERLF